MLHFLTSRPALATTTSVAALVIGVAVILPVADLRIAKPTVSKPRPPRPLRPRRRSPPTADRPRRLHRADRRRGTETDAATAERSRRRSSIAELTRCREAGRARPPEAEADGRCTADDCERRRDRCRRSLADRSLPAARAHGDGGGAWPSDALRMAEWSRTRCGRSWTTMAEPASTAPPPRCAELDRNRRSKIPRPMPTKRRTR